jgi:hypothetical protein
LVGPPTFFFPVCSVPWRDVISCINIKSSWNATRYCIEGHYNVINSTCEKICPCIDENCTFRACLDHLISFPA